MTPCTAYKSHCFCYVNISFTLWLLQHRDKDRVLELDGNMLVYIE